MTLPQGRDGLSAREMAVLWAFHEPSLCRHVRRELIEFISIKLLAAKGEDESRL